MDKNVTERVLSAIMRNQNNNVIADLKDANMDVKSEHVDPNVIIPYFVFQNKQNARREERD